MAKGNSQKTANGSALDFEAQLLATAEQAVPASHCNRQEWWPCASTTTWKLARMNLVIGELKTPISTWVANHSVVLCPTSRTHSGQLLVLCK